MGCLRACIRERSKLSPPSVTNSHWSAHNCRSGRLRCNSHSYGDGGVAESPVTAETEVVLAESVRAWGVVSGTVSCTTVGRGEPRRVVVVAISADVVVTSTWRFCCVC